MGLTPEDVRATSFRVALRGYAVAEVDAFLDQVEAELARLLEGSPASGPVPAREESCPAGSDSDVAVPGGPSPTDRALRTLVLAEQTAERLVAEAAAEADQTTSAAAAEAAEVRGHAQAEAAALVLDSRRRSEVLLDGARAEAEDTLSAARAEADRLVREAGAEAERLVREARRTAAEAERDALQRREQQIAGLDLRRAALEDEVRRLEVLARASADRVRSLLQEQVRALQGLQDREVPDTSVSAPLARVAQEDAAAA